MKRYAPALLACIVTLLIPRGETCIVDTRDTLPVQAAIAVPVSPPPCPQSAAELALLSQQAASLTGVLALVPRGERPDQARSAARQVARMANHVSSLPEGKALAQVLGDLASSLSSYAGGDPAGIAGVQAASARNAELRATYHSCIEGGTIQ